MALNINHHAAAYGLFHLAYLVLDGRVGHSLFLLRKSRDAGIRPEEFQRGTFGKRLQELRDELECLRDNTSLNDECEYQDVEEEIQALKGACELAREVANWRNARIHPAQIQIVEDQHVFVPCDERGGPLLMDSSECGAQIRRAVHANTEMQVNVERLVVVDKRFDPFSPVAGGLREDLCGFWTETDSAGRR
jgi:hypothetical protein